MEPSPVPGCHHLRGGFDGDRHVAGEFAVGAAFDVEDRRLVRQRNQTDGGAVAGHRRLCLAADGLLVEDVPGGVLRDGDQRGLALPRLDQVAGQLHSQHEGRASAVVQIEHPIRFHAKAMRHPAAAAVERHVRQLDVGDQDVDVRDGVLAVAFDRCPRRPVPPCRWRSRPRPRGGGTSAPEHHVVAQVIGLGEAGVIVGAGPALRADTSRYRAG